jgi:ABC-type transporter MlaC component
MLVFRICMLFLIFISGLGQALACDTEPDLFVLDLGGRVTEVLTNSDLDQISRKRELRDIFVQNVAVDEIGRIVLGRHWAGTSQEQRARFFEVFPDYVSGLYADQVANLDGTEIIVTDSRAFGGADELVTLQFHVPGNSPISAHFRVRCIGDTPKLLDAMISGVSLVATKRDEFVAFLQRNDVDALTDAISRID